MVTSSTSTPAAATAAAGRHEPRRGRLPDRDAAAQRDQERARHAAARRGTRPAPRTARARPRSAARAASPAAGRRPSPRRRRRARRGRSARRARRSRARCRRRRARASARARSPRRATRPSATASLRPGLARVLAAALEVAPRHHRLTGMVAPAMLDVAVVRALSPDDLAQVPATPPRRLADRHARPAGSSSSRLREQPGRRDDLRLLGRRLGARQRLARPDRP